jgi:O-6-methylguanine DNA methyltransferase
MEVMREKVESPIGELVIEVSPRGVCRITFGDDEDGSGAIVVGPSVTEARGSHGAARALRRYFAGDLRALGDVAVDVAGTPFQLRVWEVLRSIAPGRVLSYADVAKRIGQPRGFRAVGLANRSNPVPLLIPCHRVIAADGSIGGYAPGVDRKVWLLRHEGYLLT